MALRALTGDPDTVLRVLRRTGGEPRGGVGGARVRRPRRASHVQLAAV